MTKALTLIAAASLALTLALPAAAEEGGALRRAVAAAQAKDWRTASDEARASGPLAVALVDWHRLRAGRMPFAEAAAFLAAHSGWPSAPLLRERAEDALTADTPDAAVNAFFAEAPPQTARGAAAWARAGGAEAGARAAAIWAAGKVPLSEADEAEWLARWPGALHDAHAARAEALLDAGQHQAARRMLRLLSHADAQMAELRADLQSGGPRLPERLAALHRTEAADAGLNLDIFRWHVARKDAAAAQDLMLRRSASAESLRAPAAWAGKRADYARAALRAGNPALARILAERHHLPPTDAAWVDLEWLAGYAALKAGDRDGARAHFEALGRFSQAAITQSRALYWQAQVAPDEAARAALLAQAARHQSAFYGQLAAERSGIAPDPALRESLADVPDWRGAAIREDARVQAALWLLASGQTDLAQRFLVAAAEGASGEDIARLARLMAEFGHMPQSLRLAKAAAQKGAVHPAVLFPVPDIADAYLPVPPELTLAIARRESEFNAAVESPAGARGLMQVMPDTARHIAGDVGLPFDLRRLSTEAGYNALYGATYLQGLRARFGPSIALVAAGYNAGPQRSDRWLGDAGDPRAGADPVDWVEAIPFDETRNYVMRVAEALAVYRLRLGQTVPRFALTADLTGGGVLSVPIPRPVLAPAASARPPRSALRLAATPTAAAAQAGSAAPAITPAPVAAPSARAPLVDGAAPAATPAPASAPTGKAEPRLAPSIPPPAAP